MIRRYCDCCLGEITEQRAGRLTRQLYIEPGKAINVEVLTAWNGGWNAGDLCHDCIVRAVVEGSYSERTSPPVRSGVTGITGGMTLTNGTTPPEEAEALRERIRSLP